MQIPSYEMIQVVKNKTQNIIHPGLTSRIYGYTLLWVTIELKRDKVGVSKF